MTELKYHQLDNKDLEGWFDFVASVFTAGRQYFVNHWNNDFAQSRNTNGIFVCVDSGKIVGSVRVFRRNVFINGKIVLCGGIGEVSTAESHRNKGIASTLLKMSIEYMRKEEMQISSLHTGNANAMKLYKSLGWIPQKRNYIKRELKPFLETLSLTNNEFVLLKTDFEKHSLELDELQKKFNTTCAWNGPLQRTPEYWISWVKNESPHSYILKKANKIVAYVSLGPKKREESTISVKDFACSVEEENGIWILFTTIISFAISQVQLENKEWIDKITHIIFPKIILPKLQANEGECSDDGFMYMNFSSPDLIEALSNQDKHVFWDVDNF